MLSIFNLLPHLLFVAFIVIVAIWGVLSSQRELPSGPFAERFRVIDRGLEETSETELPSGLFDEQFRWTDRRLDACLLYDTRRLHQHHRLEPFSSSSSVAFAETLAMPDQFGVVARGGRETDPAEDTSNNRNNLQSEHNHTYFDEAIELIFESWPLSVTWSADQDHRWRMWLLAFDRVDLLSSYGSLWFPSLLRQDRAERYTLFLYSAAFHFWAVGKRLGDDSFKTWALKAQAHVDYCIGNDVLPASLRFECSTMDESPQYRLGEVVECYSKISALVSDISRGREADPVKTERESTCCICSICSETWAERQATMNPPRIPACGSCNQLTMFDGVARPHLLHRVSL